MNFERFKDKVVLVIGAGAGMGEVTALQFLKEGAKVIALDVFDDRIHRLQEKAAEWSGQLDVYVGDITKKDTVENVVKLIAAKHGTLDSLAYVAGVMDMMLLPDDLTEEIWDYVMDVNVKSVWRVIKEAMPLMENHEQPASVVIVSSIGGLVGSSSGTAYITSKHAVEGLKRSLAFSYQEKNVRVNSVAPGGFKTEIADTTCRLFPEFAQTYGVSPAGLQFYSKKGIVQLKPQVKGNPQSIADAIAFLCSQEAGFINGATLLVDGGWYSA